MAKTVTLGLMSGTSLDGVDAVAVDFSGVGPRLIGHHHIEFPKPLKEKLLALCQPGDNEIDRMGVASVELGKFYVHCVNELLDVADIGRKDVAAVGIHGQTIRHRPEQGWTLQLNNPALVAELSGLDVISDFRSRCSRSRRAQGRLHRAVRRAVRNGVSCPSIRAGYSFAWRVLFMLCAYGYTACHSRLSGFGIDGAKVRALCAGTFCPTSKSVASGCFCPARTQPAECGDGDAQVRSDVAEVHAPAHFGKLPDELLVARLRGQGEPFAVTAVQAAVLVLVDDPPPVAKLKVGLQQAGQVVEPDAVGFYCL